MSSIAKPMKFDYLANGKVEKFLFSDEDDEENDFSFKYVPTDQFKHIVKDVRRQRSHEKDEKIWSTFNKQKSARNPLGHHHSDINLELHNIEPEICCQTQKKCKSTRITRKCDEYSETRVRSRWNSISSMKDEDDDDDDSTLERSPISRLDVKSKNSSSDSTVKSIKHKKNRLLKKITRVDCNSSPNLSSHYSDSDDHECLQIQPHPAICQKILGLQCRISELLDEISYRLCRIPPADGENDLKRRQKRVVEFGIRFSRNYLYDLGRQMADIQRHLKAILADDRDKRRGVMLHMQALEQKLSSSHQLVVCALTAYCNHIPSSVLQGHPDKLKEILAIVVELKGACDQINLTAESVGGGDTGFMGLGNDLQNRCYAILSKLHLHSDNELHILSAPQSASTLKRRNNGLENFKVLANRFSMYASETKFPKTQRQRRPVTVGVYPKDRSIPRGSLNNPPPTPEQIYASSVGQKSAKESTKKKNRINGLHREDEIKTMMDIISTKSDKSRNYGIDIHNKVNTFGNAGSGRVPRKIHSAATTAVDSKISVRSTARLNSEKNSKTSIKSTSRQSSNRTIKKGEEGAQVADKKLNSLVPFIADLMNLAVNKDNEEGDQSDAASIHTLLEIIEKIKQSDKNPFIPEAKPVESKDLNKDNMLLIEMSNIPEKEDDGLEVAENAKPKNMEVEDCSYTQLTVSKGSSDKLLKYREDYNASSSLNPMYTSNSPNKPWEVVAWIADKLVDELIISVSKDLEITEVIQKLYDLEFLEF